MTRTASARIAGITFLLYIAVGITALVLFGRATGGEDIAAKLAGIAQHAPEVRLTIVLSLLMCFSALVLAVTLYGITRDEDHELAVLAMACRIGEGVLGGAFMVPILGLLWIATADGANALPREQAHAIAAFLLRVDGWSPLVSAIFFAVGSTLFSWLFLRGRLIPIALAWLGVVASLILVAALPLRLAGILGEPIASLIWLPMLVFEVALALVFIIRGVPERPQQYRSDPRGGEPFRA